jgi:hypothetical protein
MSRLGCKKINSATKKKLLRTNPKKINYDSKNNQLKEHLSLIESFSQEDFLQYENLINKFSSGQGTINNMFQYMDNQGIISGPSRTLAEIRLNNRYLHQKIIQQLRSRWYDYNTFHKDKVKNNSNLFWQVMVNKLSRSQKERKIHLSEKWQGDEGKAELKNFLIKLFEKQEGKCALSGVPIVLELGKNRPLPNKCSLDRINSNNGYTQQNVWFVAWWVNQMKMDQTMDDFKERVLLLAKSFKKLDINSK